MSTSTLILIYLGAALSGSFLPFIRGYLGHFHNLVSLVISVCLEGGRKNKIKLHWDGTGETTGNANRPFKKALITYAGYTGTLAAAIGMFYLIATGSYHLVIYLFLGLTVVALLLWIRNVSGIAWGLSAVVLLALPVYFRYESTLPAYFRFGMVLPININYELVLIHISVFLASVLFTQSIICAFQVCKQSFMRRSNPERKATLVQTKFVPAVVLGLTLVGQTVYAGFYLLQTFISLPFKF